MTDHSTSSSPTHEPAGLNTFTDELVKAMEMSGISKSQVSRLCAKIEERMNAAYYLSHPT